MTRECPARAFYRSSGCFNAFQLPDVISRIDIIYRFVLLADGKTKQ